MTPKELIDRALEAQAKRPEVPASDLFVPLIGANEPISLTEINQDAKPMFFLCLRVAGHHLVHIAPGSVQRECRECLQSVWMHPYTLGTMRRVARPLVICDGCIGEIERIRERLDKK